MSCSIYFSIYYLQGRTRNHATYYNFVSITAQFADCCLWAKNGCARRTAGARALASSRSLKSSLDDPFFLSLLHHPCINQHNHAPPVQLLSSASVCRYLSYVPAMNDAPLAPTLDILPLVILVPSVFAFYVHMYLQ